MYFLIFYNSMTWDIDFFQNVMFLTQMFHDINEKWTNSVKFIMQVSMVLYSYSTIFNYSSTVFQSKFTKAIVRLLCSLIAHRLPHVKDSPFRKLRIEIFADTHNVFCRNQTKRCAVTCSSCKENKTYNWPKYL